MSRLSDAEVRADQDRAQRVLDAVDHRWSDLTARALAQRILALSDEALARGEELATARGLLEDAWGIIANAGGDDWLRETEEWQGAAARWRDRWFAFLVGPAAR